MQRKKLIIGCMLLLLTLFGIAIIVTQTVETVQATVRCTPPMQSLEDPPPEYFRITIKLPAPYKAEDIIPSSILVGGIVPMATVPDWPKVTKNFFAFKVDGPSVVNYIILPIIWHMAPAPGAKVDLPITVTGQLNGGNAFEGTFDITVMTEHASPPPPP